MRKIRNIDVNDSNVTRYGEFVTSYFAWLPLDTQKEQVQRLVNITKSKTNEKI